MDSENTDKLRFSPTSNLACSTQRPKTMKTSNKGKRKRSKTCVGTRKKRIYKRSKFEKSFVTDESSWTDSPKVSSPELESEPTDFDSSAGFGSEYECIQQTTPARKQALARSRGKRLFVVIPRNTFVREEQHPSKKQIKDDKNENRNGGSRFEPTASTSSNP